jgi:peptidoglycan hydrolase CwlO-like protein
MDKEIKKKKILWISVGIISTTIFIFWIYIFSHNAQSILNNKQADSIINIPEIKENFNDINEELTKVQKTIDSTIKEKSPPEKDAETIKKEIEENLKKQLDQSTSTNIYTPAPKAQSD